MDVRTAIELCMHDLVPLIDAGDFRRCGEAEKIVDSLAASAPTDRDRGALLFWLSERLATTKAPVRPEGDALLRAVRSVVRRKLEKRFARRRLTLRVAGA